MKFLSPQSMSDSFLENIAFLVKKDNAPTTTSFNFLILNQTAEKHFIRSHQITEKQK